MTLSSRHPESIVGKPDRFRISDWGFRIRIDGLVQRTVINPQSAIRNPKSRGAFTLLELIVAMALMVIVASCLYTALYTGFRAYRSAQATVDPTSVAMNVIELLKQDICGVLPPGSNLAGAFIGTDSGGVKGVDIDSLEFYTTHISADDAQLAGLTVTSSLAGQAGNASFIGGIGKVALLLEEDSETKDGTYLLLREVTTNLLAPNQLVANEQVLCRNVVSLNLRYYDGSDWLDEWDSTADSNSLPLAVEVDIEIARHDKGSKELQKRRLTQSFAIPCKTAETTESETATSGTSTSSATKSSTQGQTK